jgi:DNA invertase Pin-like site-specific DNA recombinase
LSPAEKNYIDYHRVSTEKQGKSGYGIEAQKTKVKKSIEDVWWVHQR